MDNEDCSSTEGRNYGPHRIPRVTLDSSAWTDRQLDLFTSLAPPSYEDSVLTDQSTWSSAVGSMGGQHSAQVTGMTVMHKWLAYS